jgi:hypothetical protein
LVRNLVGVPGALGFNTFPSGCGLVVNRFIIAASVNPSVEKSCASGLSRMTTSASEGLPKSAQETVDAVLQVSFELGTVGMPIEFCVFRTILPLKLLTIDMSRSSKQVGLHG